MGTIQCRSNIRIEITAGDIVVDHMPDCGEDLSVNGKLHFHLVLSANDSLMVAELVEVTTWLSGCGPGAFD